ncbi:MAG TPA: hypothetical protein VEC36_12375 [Patescibacteria group bacterium]|nr:hypothetical protein [Patescibacteria group bacterium]
MRKALRGIHGGLFGNIGFIFTANHNTHNILRHESLVGTDAYAWFLISLYAY